MKDVKKIVLSFLIVLLVVFILCPQLFIMSVFTIFEGYGRVTQTTDVSDYGLISGNYDNDTPAQLIFTFFPERISSTYSNVSYRYTAQKADAYACQIWLEFDIADKDEFDSFVHTYTDSQKTGIFTYDTSYMDYTVWNQFQLTNATSDKPGDIHIEYARIGKIMYNESTQHIICYALCIYDGGYSSTKVFGDFFDRFDIDPVEYASTVSVA